MSKLPWSRWLMMAGAAAIACGVPTASQAQVQAGSGSYATAWETPIYNDNGFFGPTVPEMQSTYNTLYLDPSLKTVAIPTNQWWTDLMFGLRGSGSWTQQAPWNTQLWVLPELVLPTSQGMSLYFPSTWNPRSGAAEAFNFGTPINVTGANGFAATSPVVKSYGDWTMTYSLTDSATGGSMTTTLARGVPFVWVQYNNVTPQISGGAFYDANGNQITASTYTGSMVATMVGGETFGIYTPANTTFTVSGANLIPNIPSSSYVVYAVLPDKSYLSTFAQYAYAMPTGSKMTYTYNRAAGQIQTTWTLTTTSLNGSGGTSTLQGWLPHHYRTTTNNLTFQPYTYLTPRGTLKLAAANTFSINWPFRGIAPVLPAPHANDTTNDYNASRMQQYVDSFASAHPGFGGDTYAQGQELGLGAQYLTMADQLGLTSDESAILSNLENVMDDWYTYTPGEGGSNGASARYFVRDTKYGSFIGDVPGFGSESYNDNHFHYGYFLTASALTGMKDQTWLNNYLPLITMIAKDYANWDRTDTTYPYFRTFDAWEGHSWANGISTSSGENQESSSEAMQSWIGLFMLGNMSGNQAMADAGAMGYAMESSATNEYWQDWKKTNFPSGYGFNGAGQVTSGQILYSTNFGGDPAFIYGIQFCPTNHWNNYLVRDTTYAAGVLNNLWSERTTAANQGLFQLNDANNNISVLGGKWGNYWLGYQELFDPSTVAGEMDQYWTSNQAVADDGELAGPVYYLAHTLRSLGLQDTNYYTNVPTSQVYYNSTTGQRTVVVYNPQSTAQTATVYNNGTSVASVSVPARTEMSFVLTSGSGAPIPPTGLAGTPGNNQIQLSWIEPATQPAIGITSYNLYRSTTPGGEGTTPYKSGLTSTSFTDTAVANGTTYYYKVAAVNGSGSSANSGETSCTPAVAPASITDPLNDFSMVSSKSANWTFDTSNTAYFNGDTSRAIRSTDDTEYLVYKYSNIVGFSVRVFFLGGNLGQISLYISTDNGSTWQSAPVLDGVAASGQAGWYYFNLTNNGALPAGVTNLKIQLASGSGNNWDPQISQVTLYYTGGSSTLPAVPTGLSAAAGNAQVSLSWTASANATSYNVYRATTAGGEGSTPIATGLTGTTYTNTGLTNGTKYYYTVAAVDSAGTSAQSSEVSAAPIGVPAAPTGLSATSGNAQVALSWTGSANATSYNVYRSTTAGGEGTTPVASGVTGTSYTITGLTNGTTYYFTVAAVNAAGTSTQSTEVNSTPQVPLPSTPTGLTATAGNTQVSLSWTASSGATSYNVYRATTAGGEGSTPIATGITSTSYVNTGLTNGTKYYFTVAAVNAAGTSTQSTEVNATPAGATSQTITDYLNDWTIIRSKSANWTLDGSNVSYFAGDTSRATRTVDDTEYLIYTFSGITTFNATVYTWNGPVTVATFWYSTNNGSTWTQCTVNYGTKTAVASGWGYYNVVPSATLPAGVTNLKVQFTSGTGNGWDPQLSQISITYSGSGSGGGTAPSTPTGLSATAGNGQVGLSWAASSGATSYNVYRSTTSGGEGSTPIATGITSTSYTNTGLTNGTKYYFTVAAVNSAGTSAQSTEASATPQLPLPGTPTGLAATAGNAQVALTWTASSNAASYNVYRSTTTGGETLLTSGVTSTSYTDTGLTNGTTYYYKVAAVDSTGTSALSSEVSATPAGSTGTSGPVSINCGGSASSPFVADVDFSGGTTGSTTNTIATPFVSNPIPPQAILQSWRMGTFTYTLPGFTAGTGHTVELFFMDPTSTANGQRNFNVSINGSQVLTNFDVYAAAQGQYRAIQENFNATSNASGQIVISFTAGTAGQPIVEGITVPN